MRIETERKLDFDDVLIRPKRSRLKSRGDVDVKRTFKMPHAGGRGHGRAHHRREHGQPSAPSRWRRPLPNMTSSPRYTSITRWKNCKRRISRARIPSRPSASTTSRKSTTVLNTLKSNSINKICLDVANGYTENFVEFIQTVREHHPGKVIMAGNVATPDMTEALILGGRRHRGRSASAPVPPA